MDLTTYLQRHRHRFVEELNEFLRIPSVSARSEHKADVRACADFLAERMREAGLPKVEVVDTAGHPVVWAERTAAPARPTLLFYGHYDVQPVDPLNEWTSPPFEPQIRNGRLYARGSADDKGQVYLHLKALQAFLETSGELPVNLKFLVEGEEEVGSPNLEPFLRKRVEELSCDGVLISDTPMFDAKTPSICVGLRGLVYLEVHVQGPKQDLHSGSYGGSVVNPANALAQILTRLKDESGRVTIPHFYDRVKPLSPQEKRSLAALPFDERAYREELGVPALGGGESAFGPLERIWARPTLDVNGLLSGYTGEGSKTIIPARAMAKVSCRLVPEQDPAEIERRFVEHVLSLAPAGVRVEVRRLHGAQPWSEDPAGPLFQAAGRALERAFGRTPVFTREGGSIPIVPLFQQTLRAPCVLLGFTLPNCNAHSPNEWIDVDLYQKGIHTVAALYEELRDVRL
jgi:acetylornithine deacetylase/succinyl-diaminopimelate desuccinylase-like protein